MSEKKYLALTSGTPTAEGLLRTLLGREVGNLLRYDPVVRQTTDPEGVHQLRVITRRLRSELRVLRPIMTTVPFERMDRRLRWLGGALGRQRDLDILHEVLTKEASESTYVEDVVLPDLGLARRRERRRLGETLDSPRYALLLVGLCNAVINPPLRARASRSSMKVFLPGLRAVTVDLFDFVDSLTSTP